MRQKTKQMQYICGNTCHTLTTRKLKCSLLYPLSIHGGLERKAHLHFTDSIWHNIELWFQEHVKRKHSSGFPAKKSPKKSIGRVTEQGSSKLPSSLFFKIAVTHSLKGKCISRKSSKTSCKCLCIIMCIFSVPAKQ